MIVSISWVSFWLQADASPPRIMLGTSTMLTFITLASAQGKTLPKVSYIKVRFLLQATYFDSNFFVIFVVIISLLSLSLLSTTRRCQKSGFLVAVFSSLEA